jgi:DNA-binding SARP family transcriptional activator
MWRDPGHASVTQFRQRRGALHDPRAEVVRSTAAWLAGDMAGSAALASALEGRTGAPGLAFAASDALRLLVDGNPPAALAVARRGLAMAADEAIHGFDAWLHLLCAASALAQNDVAAARADLDAAASLPLRRGDRAFVHYLRSGLARASAEPGAALREDRSAAVLAVESGLPWLECVARLAMAQMLGAARERASAEAQVRSALALAQRLSSTLLRVSALFTQAGVALDCGDEAAALAPLHEAFTLAREIGAHHAPGLAEPAMAALCAVALRNGIAVEHARLIVTSGRLAPPPAALRLRAWPWAFEITTLGGFGLHRAGAPIEFSAKGPGRPVELLKVLVSMGGQNVRADLLADALWPHVDADYAHKSFTATLHRLRRIFGGDDALRLSDGRLSLNATQFWLDTWATEHLLNEIDACLRADDARAAAPTLSALITELLALYRGPYLPDEAEQPAYIARREQLRARLLRALTRLARRWEDRQDDEAAVDCYLRFIDADELCEPFYRNLMLCYQRRGEVAEALATYDRLHAVLAARLRSTPSPETQAIHTGLRG